jgi:hypothetical protein
LLRLTVLIRSLGSIGRRLGSFLMSAFASGESAFAVLAEVQTENRAVVRSLDVL